MNSNKKIVFHIDVNSAFLSWEAAYRLQQGEKIDLREISSVVGGNEESRHGIVLAKSIPAKKFSIKTGEPLFTARQKCPELVVVPPRHNIYMQCSDSLVKILEDYTPVIQRYSIDECFLDFTNMKHIYTDIIKLANDIRERVKRELGFTVNIGISNNKLLAKMASDFKKPDKVHTLFPEEIKSKMWPLPIEDLFFVGRATLPKLNKLNIFTIGDLANYDLNIIKNIFKSHGVMIWNYANGIDNSEVRKSNRVETKSIGNSTTLPFDVKDKETAHKILLSLAETVGMRLRKSQNCCKLVAIYLRDADFISYSHQIKLYCPTDSTKIVSRICFQLFDECWKYKPLRSLGVSVGELCSNDFCQSSIFDDPNLEKNRSIDKAMDSIRSKYGNNSVIRGTFLYSGLHPTTGGVESEYYPIMSSIL